MLRFTPSKTLAAVAVGTTISALGLLAAPAEALRPASLFAPPSSIGVVDLATIFDRLAEGAEWDVRIRALEGGFAEEVRQKNAEIEAMRAEIDALPEGAERNAKLDAARLRRLQFEEWGALKQAELDREKSLKWQAVYRAIRDGSRKLAEAEKLDLIIVDDSRTEIRTKRSGEISLEQQAQGQIAQLRVLYSSKTVDVTEKLVVQINNARAAGPSATGTTPR